MAFAEDFDELLDVTDGFAVALTVTPAGGSARSIKGIFDAEYVDVGGDTFLPVEGAQPKVLCARSDVADIQYGDAVTIDGSGYTVTNVRPDGTGMVELILQESA